MCLLKELHAIRTQTSIFIWNCSLKRPLILRLTLEVAAKAYVKVWPWDEGHQRFIKRTIQVPPSLWVVPVLHLLLWRSSDGRVRCYNDMIGCLLHFVRLIVIVLNRGLTHRAPVRVGRRRCEALLIVWGLGHFVSAELVVCHLTCPGGLWRLLGVRSARAIDITGAHVHVHRALSTKLKVCRLKIVFQRGCLIRVYRALVWHRA